MRPAKLLAAIALMRKLKITHVVEDGRYGGLSALIYALHGFHVTSIEFLPLGHVSAALGSHGNVHLVDGDSRQKVVEVIEELQTSNAAVAVIFDGLKRFEAYEVYQKSHDSKLGWLSAKGQRWFFTVCFLGRLKFGALGLIAS
eukprot:g3616.t1